jgi:cytoskeletal protein CcmA (bactofilin family)
MFHRARKDAIKPQASSQPVPQRSEAKQKTSQHDNNMDQTAVRQYAKPQEEAQNNSSANQNGTEPYAVKKIDTNVNNQNSKEAKPMNNAQPKQENDTPSNASQQSSSQTRVDIPGQNFQRPGAAPAQGNRPNYPGASYPGAQSSNSYTQANDSDDNSRKLVIGQGITMSGEIEACDHLIVQGTIEASLKGANVLDVAETGSYFGTVEIEEANIAGRFEGDITVNGRLTIESTGTIIGSVTYKELSMEAGATLDGSVSPIGSQNAAKNKKAAPSKAKKVSSNNGAELPFANQPE